MMEVLLIKATQTLDITNLVHSVEWKGTRYSAPRSVLVTLTSINKGYHQGVEIEEGDGLLFSWGNVELYRGTVFDLRKRKGGILSVLTYDNLIYFTKNTDSYVFINKKASDYLERICGDFKISMGTISDTGYVIPSLVFDNKKLYDVVMKGIVLTYKQTKNKFKLYSEKGKVNLVNQKENARKWVIEEGVNLIDYEYSSSITDTVTRVKLEAGEEKKTIITTADNGELQKKFGVLQYYEKITDQTDKAKLQQQADSIMSEQGKQKRTLDIDGIGITDVIAGVGIHVIIPELDIKKGYYVDSDTHRFQGNKHEMSLSLIETNDLPEIG